MTAKRWDGSSQQDISTAKRWDGSSWVDITTAKRWDGNAWHDIAFAGGGGPGGGGPASLSAVASGDAIIIHQTYEPPFDPVVTLITPIVTVTASGGAPPYTYQWTRISGDHKASCDSPTSPTATWTANLYLDTTSESVWRCTVTDSIGGTAYVDVLVFLAYYAGVIP